MIDPDHLPVDAKNNHQNRTVILHPGPQRLKLRQAQTVQLKGPGTQGLLIVLRWIEPCLAAHQAGNKSQNDRP